MPSEWQFPARPQAPTSTSVPRARTIREHRPKVGRFAAVAVLTSLIPAGLGASDHKLLGEVDFFGYKGFDPVSIRSALPFHEGDRFPPPKVKSSEDLKRRVRESVRQVLGREPTSVSLVCCDPAQNWMVYIGLPGESYRPVSLSPAPMGKVRLPKAALALNSRLGKAVSEAVMKGQASEDDSEGFAVFNEPKARAAALAVQDYALANLGLVVKVLADSGSPEHRRAAAQMLGYGRQSNEQVDALARASLDPDDGVRNAAIRALWVLAAARPNLAQRMPPETFIKLLRSGAWEDHNKASLLLLALTKSRDPKLLALLRSEALDSIAEMARWRNPGHAYAALSVLGRIAGIEEASLQRMIEAGQVDTIMKELR